MMQILRFNIKFFRFNFLLLSLFAVHCSTGQELTIVSSAKQYQNAAERDSFQKMVDLQQLAPGVVVELRYASKYNFTKQRLYPKGNATFMRLAPAAALQKIAAELSAMGYGLKIWDAYRPYSVTKKMWDLVGDERYVANPAKGSGHNRGLAVDLTLLKDGKEIAMGTPFDNFTDTAHHNFIQLPENVINNRQLLRKTMEKYGFRALETEWWHYSWPNDRQYEVLDLPFKKLRKLTH